MSPTTPGSSKLVLIDGNAIMHRAYHALPPLTGNDNQPINAVYGLTSMLLKVIADLKPTHIAFAFDRKEPTFRKKMLESYQAHRPEMDTDLSSQFAIAREVIASFGIPIYDKAGFEADDVIGTIASKCLLTQVVVVTGDRDMLQLIDDKVNLYMPIGGLANAKQFGENEAKNKMGVLPDKIVDYKALVGDPSDNYKGVPGIGPKTAIKLLDEFGTLDNIYKNLDGLPPRTKTLLVINKDSAYVSQKLATIVRDVDINIDFAKMEIWDLGNPEVSKVFARIGFKTLAKRTKKFYNK